MIPGSLPFYLASIIGRLPQGGLSLLLILRTRELTGSYAAGGLVAGAFSITLGLGAPLLGRYADRHGQRPMLLGCTVASLVTILAFAALPDGSSTLVAVLIALVMGMVQPPLNAVLRAVWAQAATPEQRHKVFAFDSAMLEITYIAGPLLLVGLIGAASLRAGLVAAAAFVTVGTVAVAGSTLTREWRSGGAADSHLLGALRAPGLRWLMLAFGCAGLAVGSVEIGLAAFARRHGSPGAVGVLFSLWAVGSLVGGLIAVRTPAPAAPGRRLAWLFAAMAVCDVPLALVDSVGAMAAATMLAGLLMAPAFALIFAMVAEVATAGTVTEANTWMSSAVGAGVALGSAAGGALVDGPGTTAALALVAVYALAASAVVAWSPLTA